NGRPDGNEAVSNLQSLSRELSSKGGQVIESYAYFYLGSFQYTTTLPTFGSPGINYYKMIYAYDARGRLNRTQSPTGTVTLTVYDGRNRPVSQSVGTSDANAVKVVQAQYDGGGVGDGNLTQLIQFPSGGTVTADQRVTQFYFDWRNRLVASKS